MLATLLPRYICIARVEFLWCCMQQQLQEQRLYTCHMHAYIRTTSMTATSSCSTAKLLQFVCKIVLQIEQERWRKQKAQSLLHTHTHTLTRTHTAASCSKVGQTSWHVASASTSASASTATPKGLQPQPEHVVYQKFS